MGEHVVKLKKDGEIATIYFNRAEKRNAMNYDMWVRIKELVNECDADESVKVIIFRGVDESAFSAGADIGEFRKYHADAEAAERFNKATIEAEAAIMNTKKPTIAMVQGFCIGGGCELATACDFRFSDQTGKFAVTPAKLGLVYNLPATKNLVDLVGPAKAKDILFTGRIMDADEALRIGLIDRIYSSEELETETYAYAQTICNNAQLTVRSAKQIIRTILEGASENTDEITELVLSSFASDDYGEGVNAFLNKRKPKFKYL